MTKIDGVKLNELEEVRVRVIGVYWQGTGIIDGGIGFVAVQTNEEKILKCYVGRTLANSEIDKLNIASWGGKVEPHIANAIFPHLVKKGFKFIF